MSPASPYDDVPYPGSPLRVAHPDHLIATARLLGVRPPRLGRILELGCGDGANLVPMALTHPGAAFVGVDLSAKSIDVARACAHRLGLTNLDLRAGDLRAVDLEGDFDIILAHGLVSWVPRTVREAVFARIEQLLAPDGIALISHAVLPGDRASSLLRQELAPILTSDRPPLERVERARDQLADRLWSLDPSHPDTEVLRRRIGHLAGVSDAVFFHDLLAPERHPERLERLVEQAAAHGLQFLCDAQLVGSFNGTSRLGLQREQQSDETTDRLFRTTLLGRQQPKTHLRTFDDLWLAAPPQRRHAGLVPEALEAAWPRPLPVSKFGDPEPLVALAATGHLHIATGDRRIAATRGSLFPPAVEAARRGATRVPNLWHTNISLEPGEREALLSGEVTPSLCARALVMTDHAP